MSSNNGQRAMSSEVGLSNIKQLNAKPLAELLDLLASRQPILMAGAGCSVNLGYSDWWTIVENMRDNFTPSVQFSRSTDVKVAAELVKLKCREEHKDCQPLERYIREQFSPKQTNSSPFHSRLVRLGFAGFVTTNYDEVLECSLRTTWPSCGLNPINLCDESMRYLTLEFFKHLGEEPCRHVLHLHGYYDRPDRIILALSDYQYFYDNVPRGTTLDKRNMVQPQDTLHRRTIWALLVTRPLVFVGFSLRDDFFIDVISVWKKDLDLRMECPHFAFMGISSDTDMENTAEKLRDYNVKPIFYEIPCGDPCDHSGLHTLINDLANRIGIPMAEPDVNTISQRTLEML